MAPQVKPPAPAAVKNYSGGLFGVGDRSGRDLIFSGLGKCTEHLLDKCSDTKLSNLSEKNMPNFMIAYYGGNQPSSEEEGMAQWERWKSWIAGLGDAVVNPGTPLRVSKIVTSSSVEDDSDSDTMKGFAVVKAENMEAAVEIARSDPFLDSGGTIRVSQMMEMK